MHSITIRSSNRLAAVCRQGLAALGLCMGGIGLTGLGAQAQSARYSTAIVGLDNLGTFIDTLSRQDTPDNTTASAFLSQNFTGLDGAGNTQTMSFTGTTIARADYGGLHSYTSASILNSYYNASNPAYTDHNGNTINTSGSPSSLIALGFASFDDTLQFGGELQAGYKARYIFHVDGTNSGTGAFAGIAVDIDGAPGDSFFATNVGSYDELWSTKDFDINGITPQTIHVQFSDQVVLDLFNLTDGQNYSGTSDFSSTATLAGIQVVDASGNPVSGWTVSSASGTSYPLLQDTPEPGVTALLFSLTLPASFLLRRARKRSRG